MNLQNQKAKPSPLQLRIKPVRNSPSSWWEAHGRFCSKVYVLVPFKETPPSLLSRSACCIRVSKSALVRLLWKRNCAQCDMFTPPTSKSCVVVGSCNFRERRIVIWGCSSWYNIFSYAKEWFSKGNCIFSAMKLKMRFKISPTISRFKFQYFVC